MTLNQLRAFLEVVRLGSFTAAAAALDVSQASVSELVRRLEDEYAVPLFVRGPRQLTVTSAGQELIEHAERAVESADAAAQALRSVRGLAGGVATFGVLRNAEYYVLSGLAQRFTEIHPEVRVRLIGLNSADVASSVASGELEAGLIVLPIDVEGMVVTPWARDEVVYVSADPSHTGGPVDVATAAQRRLVLYDAHTGWRDPTRRQLIDRANMAGVRLDPWIEVEHVETALNLVARGVGDTMASRAVTRSAAFPAGLHVAPFDPPMYDVIAFIRRDSVPLSSATTEIARLAQEMLSAQAPEHPVVTRSTTRTTRSSSRTRRPA